MAPLISLAVVLVAVYAAGRGPAPVAGPIGTSVTLGVHQGDSIPDYVAAMKADLRNLLATEPSATGAKAPPKFYALVSLSDYLTPDRLATVFAGLDLQITNTVMRVPSDEQTQIIQLPVNSDDLRADVERGDAGDRRQEAAARGGLRHDVDAGPGRLDDRADGPASSTRCSSRWRHWRRPATARRTDATACTPPSSTPTLPVLAQLATRPGVRAVEARQLLYPSLAVFLPPFPDQHDLAGPPPSSAPGR